MKMVSPVEFVYVPHWLDEFKNIWKGCCFSLFFSLLFLFHTSASKISPWSCAHCVCVFTEILVLCRFLNHARIAKRYFSFYFVMCSSLALCVFLYAHFLHPPPDNLLMHQMHFFASSFFSTPSITQYVPSPLSYTSPPLRASVVIRPT